MFSFLSGRSKMAAFVFSLVLLSAASYITIPMVPVPITLQTLAVTLVGAIYGWRLGGAAVILWLAAGALGLPVLADGSSGLEKFTGPTAGYLLAFPLAAALTGTLVHRGWNESRLILACLAMAAGTALCLLMGAAWLAFTIGLAKAWIHGVVPFLIGGVIKSIAGALALRAIGFVRRPLAMA